MAGDSTFFDVFTFPLIKGDPKTVLKNPDGILIYSSMSKKYFGEEDPLGKHLAVNDEEDLVQVVGVFMYVPIESHFHFDFLVSYIREKDLRIPKVNFIPGVTLVIIIISAYGQERMRSSLKRN